MVVVKHRGNFKNLEKFLKDAEKLDISSLLEHFGKEGVRALASATPIDSGLTANSWGYEVKVNKGTHSITWTNSNVVDGVPIAIILQYGHGTRNGGYIRGRDYINPAIGPVFDRISEDVWREVTK